VVPPAATGKGTPVGRMTPRPRLSGCGQAPDRVSGHLSYTRQSTDEAARRSRRTRSAREPTVISRRATTSLAILSALLLLTAACTAQQASGPGSPDPSTGVTATAVPASTAPVASTPPVASAAPTASAPPVASSPPGATSAALPTGLESAQPAPPLEGLVNADGTPFRLTDFAGTPTLVFFGYTHCPDVCPATIGEIFGVFQAAPETQAVFVSVDPERDTPEFLASWTEYFPEGFHAVTGSPGAIRRAADGYDVRYARVETSSTTGYTMSHTANVYLIDGDGRLRRIYPFGTPAAEIAADISTLQAG
jgi:protein SCO1